MYKDITGIILSGGKSTRMGENKSFLKIGGLTVIEHVVQLMKSLFNEVIIITNEPDLYKFLNIKTFSDIYSNIGPIAGIHSGLVNSNTDKNFIISCDMPLVNAKIIDSIIELSDISPVTIPKANGFNQYLCGVYSKSVIPTIVEIIQNDLSIENRSNDQAKRKCKMTSLINAVPAEIIDDVTKLDGYFPEIFYNMNNRDDFEFIKSVFSK